MAKRDLFKEAIAEAKAVKEVAIANAKIALEEAFTPHLKSILSQRIQEMEYEEDEEETMNMEESEETLDLSEILKEIEDDEDIIESEEEEDKDIAEILKEIEDEVDNEMEEEDEEDEEEEESLNIEDMTDEDLKDFIESVIKDMVAAGELEPNTEMEDDEMEDMDDEIDLEIEDDETEDEEIEENNIDSGAAPKSFIKQNPDYVMELRNELREANKSLIILRSKLNEVNLLNSKLLYTNKIFQSNTLSTKEKTSILESFDKATTVKEAKLVFETLNEGLKSKKQPIKESLSMASKSMGSQQKPNQIINIDPQVQRWKKLAGL
jgi:hypothetical protein